MGQAQTTSKFQCSTDQKIKIDFQLTEIEKKMMKTDYQYNFFLSLQAQFDKWENLSEKQIYCLDQIYERITR